MNNMKLGQFFIIFSLTIALTFQPLTLFAQTTGGTYNPSSSTAGNGKTFSGTSFSGVGGAIAGCANVGGLIVGAVSGLFKKDKGDDTSSGGTGQTVPTKADDTVKKVGKVEEQEKKANRTTECLNGVAYAAAKSLLQQVSNKTLTWINKGLGGNPLYVQDLSSNLRTIRDEKLQSYLNSAQKDNPIFGNALRSTITQQVTGISDGYLNKVMNTPEAKSYQSFQQDFRQGGWASFLNPNYNSVGVLLGNSDKIAKDINSEQETRINEVQRNNGFLDMRECVEYEKPQATNQPHGWDDEPAQQGTPTKAKCLRYRTVTPGSTIAQQATNILNSPTRQLEMADSINEILGAFFDQILNNLLNKGLASLQNGKSSNNGFGSFGSNVVLGSNGLPIGSNNPGDVFGYQLPGNGYDVQEFDISRPQMLRAVVQAQYDFLNRSKDSQIAMRSIVPTLGALDYCIPGPNPTWEDGLNSNFQTFITSFATPSKDRTFAGKFLSAATSSTIQAIVKLFGGGGDTKTLNAVLGGQPELFDKASGQNKELGVWNYQYFTKDYDRLVKNTDGDWIRNWISSGYDRIIARYKTDFTQDKVIALFTAVDPDTAKAKGNIKESLKETAKLVLYNENITSLDKDYTQAISDKEDAIVELEEIRNEALQIVKKAKARYIAEQAAAGTPVKLSCIDKAYVIDESPITGPARQESDTPNPIIKQSQDAANYFYSQL
jgi:hypothetical protein